MMRVSGSILLLSFLCGSLILAQDKKPEKKDLPRVLLALPLGAAPGGTTQVTLRGLKLDTATEVRFPESKATAKIVRKGKSPAPDKNPDKVGDTEVVADITVPAGTPSGVLSVIVVTPDGSTASHGILVEATIPVVAEKEPNNGFQQAQAIQIPQIVDGSIREPRDVDVFRFDGKQGQKLVFEVFAARHGSALDSILTLYDAAGQQLAWNDDIDGSTDSRLNVTLPKTGSYFLSLQDAHDLGSAMHVYRLSARLAK